MYRRFAQDQKLTLQKVSDARSYLMMLVSSLMELQKVQKESSLSISVDIDMAINELALLDEALEETQGK